MTDTNSKPADLTKKTFETIELSDPIVRGDVTIDKLNIRKPTAGELRGGLSLADFIGTDIGAILKVLPRISEPPLTEDECHNLDLSDLSEIGGTIRGFFMTKAERAMMAKIIAEQQPTT